MRRSEDQGSGAAWGGKQLRNGVVHSGSEHEHPRARPRTSRGPDRCQDLEATLGLPMWRPEIPAISSKSGGNTKDGPDTPVNKAAANKASGDQHNSPGWLVKYATKCQPPWPEPHIDNKLVNGAAPNASSCMAESLSTPNRYGHRTRRVLRQWSDKPPRDRWCHPQSAMRMAKAANHYETHVSLWPGRHFLLSCPGGLSPLVHKRQTTQPSATTTFYTDRPNRPETTHAMHNRSPQQQDCVAKLAPLNQPELRRVATLAGNLPQCVIQQQRHNICR